MNNYAKASGSKRRPHDDGDDERRRPRKGMDDRRRERLARLRQKVCMRRAIVKKEKGKEQRDEEVDEERPNKLPPTEEPPMPLALRSDFPSDHWVEPNEEALDLSPTYPNNRVSVMVPPLPPSSPPPSGLVIGAPRIPRCANCKIGARVGQPCIVQNARNRCTSCATQRIKCADDKTLAAWNARLAKGEKNGKRRGKLVKEVEEDDEEDEDQRDVSKGSAIAGGPPFDRDSANWRAAGDDHEGYGLNGREAREDRERAREDREDAGGEGKRGE
ncbi:hypothetical protein GGU10DRAFT_381305 [Lentinula aff. detonsa]|uniref:Uncharacterized protein n=1 Tax=Lentinula aff. detonsa TaxID=2804958 RepID=A0AA38KMS4_9AGAR|nr:hypothetical protein GGU10DRAFT_381305 [Lentinula aff. detonsa]